MKRLVLTIIVAVGSCFVSMCGKEDLVGGHTAPPFEGVVLDSATLAPVESVKVILKDTISEIVAALTDSVGDFSVTNFDGVDPLIFFFRKTGYVEVMHVVTPGERANIGIQRR